jgi:hypothetical protein
MAEDIAAHAPPEVVVVPISAADFETVCRYAGRHAFGQLDAAFHFAWQMAGTLRQVQAGKYAAMVSSEAVMYAAHAPQNWPTLVMVEGEGAVEAKKEIPTIDLVFAPNKTLDKFLRQITPNVVHMPAGVDTELFCPTEREQKGAFRVGWCGSQGGGRDFNKGKKSIWEPLCNLIPGCNWDANTRNYKNALPYRDMPAWYQQLDAFVCTSISEGTPLPPFEAAACGVPVVSTEVGAVREWEVLHELNMTIPPYHDDRSAHKTVKAAKDRLMRLIRDKGYRKYCGETLRTSVVDQYSWKKLAPRWLEAMLAKPEKPDE